MIRHITRAFGPNAALIAFAGVAAVAAAAPASAHEERYVYEAFVNNTYEPTYPGGEGDYKIGDTPQSVRVEGATASADRTHGGTVYAFTTLPGIDPRSDHNVEYAAARASLSYNFWVDGPDPDAFVPVRFEASGAVFGDNYLATGGLLLRLSEVGIGDGRLFEQWDERGQGGGGTGLAIASIDIDKVYYLKPSATYSIEMSASAGSQAAVFMGSTTSATLDPVFTVLGDFALNYRIVGVPDDGIVNPPGGGAVPEPATWALMLTGFGVLGASLRRRRAGLGGAAA